MRQRRQLLSRPSKTGTVCPLLILKLLFAASSHFYYIQIIQLEFSIHVIIIIIRNCKDKKEVSFGSALFYRKEIGQQGKTIRPNNKFEKRQLESVSEPWRMHSLNR